MVNIVSEICLNKNKRMYLSTDFSSFSICKEKEETELFEWLSSVLESLAIFFTVFISVILIMLFLGKVHFVLTYYVNS